MCFLCLNLGIIITMVQTAMTLGVTHTVATLGAAAARDSDWAASDFNALYTARVVSFAMFYYLELLSTLVTMIGVLCFLVITHGTELMSKELRYATFALLTTLGTSVILGCMRDVIPFMVFEFKFLVMIEQVIMFPTWFALLGMKFKDGDTLDSQIKSRIVDPDELFARLDTNGDGFIDKAELVSATENPTGDFDKMEHE